MNRTQLVFKSISEVVGGNGMAVVVLTDVDEQRAISIVCDNAAKWQIGMRTGGGTSSLMKFFPEVLCAMLADCGSLDRYEIVIDDVVEGEYIASVICVNTGVRHGIRISDAVLLSMVSNIPMYIDSQLMQRQCSVYRKDTDRMAIPINALDTNRLRSELDKAVETENYRLASLIKDELMRRNNGN